LPLARMAGSFCRWRASPDAAWTCSIGSGLRWETPSVSRCLNSHVHESLPSCQCHPCWASLPRVSSRAKTSFDFLVNLLSWHSWGGASRLAMLLSLSSVLTRPILYYYCNVALICSPVSLDNGPLVLLGRMMPMPIINGVGHATPQIPGSCMTSCGAPLA
jgi:hypothetical protein